MRQENISASAFFTADMTTTGFILDTDVHSSSPVVPEVDLISERALSKQYLHEYLPKQADQYRNSVQKRAIELTLSGIGTPPALILTGLMGLAAYLEDGHNPFYIANRLGKDGETVPVVKIRTMKPDADKYKQCQIDEFNRTGIDPRVTTVGKVLRAYELDEIPQIIQAFLMKTNLLEDKMDLIGPNRVISQKAIDGLTIRAEKSGDPSEKAAILEWIQHYTDVKPALFTPGAQQRGLTDGTKDDIQRIGPGNWMRKNHNATLDISVMSTTIAGFGAKAGRKIAQTFKKSFYSITTARNSKRYSGAPINASGMQPEISSAGD